ncbi:MAG TPA: PrsW family intramembrane metalloprotease [Pyrinomonadaceae bacterium]|nr:PrsW family intramembrane metalloprotease [Pyrinomonadaceae bacterium]
MMNNPQYPYQPQAGLIPAGIPPTAGHTGAIKIALGIAAGLIALLLGLLVLLLIGFETGPLYLLIGMLFATIPVPIYVVLVLWIDRYESEPLWLLVSAFCWGAMVAVFIAFIFNTLGFAITAAVTNSMRAGQTASAVIYAPIVEESAKAFFLFVIFFWKKDEFDGVIDGIVYASLVALGFAMTENIQYYGKAALHGGGVGLTLTFIMRGTLAPFSHPLFTSMTGIGLGLARQSTNQAIKFVTPILGLLTAMAMHSIWNGSAVMGGGIGFLLTYIVVMIPAFLILLVVIIFSLRREGRLIREFLYPEFQTGVIHQQEYEQLCSVFKRAGASFDAFTRGGVSRWRDCKQFNQVGSELAFHRSRVSRGIYRDEHEVRGRESAYLQQLQEIRNRLRVE